MSIAISSSPNSEQPFHAIQRYIPLTEQTIVQPSSKLLFDSLHAAEILPEPDLASNSQIRSRTLSPNIAEFNRDPFLSSGDNDDFISHQTKIIQEALQRRIDLAQEASDLSMRFHAAHDDVHQLHLNNLKRQIESTKQEIKDFNQFVESGEFASRLRDTNLKVITSNMHLAASLSRTRADYKSGYMINTLDTSSSVEAAVRKIKEVADKNQPYKIFFTSIDDPGAKQLPQYLSFNGHRTYIIKVAKDSMYQPARFNPGDFSYKSHYENHERTDIVQAQRAAGRNIISTTEWSSLTCPANGGSVFEPGNRIGLDEYLDKVFAGYIVDIDFDNPSNKSNSPYRFKPAKFGSNALQSSFTINQLGVRIAPEDPVWKQVSERFPETTKVGLGPKLRSWDSPMITVGQEVNFLVGFNFSSCYCFSRVSNDVTMEFELTDALKLIHDRALAGEPVKYLFVDAEKPEAAHIPNTIEANGYKTHVIRIITPSYTRKLLDQGYNEEDITNLSIDLRAKGWIVFDTLDLSDLATSTVGNLVQHNNEGLATFGDTAMDWAFDIIDNGGVPQYTPRSPNAKFGNIDSRLFREASQFFRSNNLTNISDNLDPHAFPLGVRTVDEAMTTLEDHGYKPDDEMSLEELRARLTMPMTLQNHPQIIYNYRSIQRPPRVLIAIDSKLKDGRDPQHIFKRAMIFNSPSGSSIETCMPNEMQDKLNQAYRDKNPYNIVFAESGSMEYAKTNPRVIKQNVQRLSPQSYIFIFDRYNGVSRSNYDPYYYGPTHRTVSLKDFENHTTNADNGNLEIKRIIDDATSLKAFYGSTNLNPSQSKTTKRIMYIGGPTYSSPVMMPRLRDQIAISIANTVNDSNHLTCLEPQNSQDPKKLIEKIIAARKDGLPFTHIIIEENIGLNDSISLAKALQASLEDEQLLLLPTLVMTRESRKREIVEASKEAGAKFKLLDH